MIVDYFNLQRVTVFDLLGTLYHLLWYLPPPVNRQLFSETAHGLFMAQSAIWGRLACNSVDMSSAWLQLQLILW